MKVDFVDFKLNVIHTIQTFGVGPLCLPSIGSTIKLPNKKTYYVVKSFVDYSKMGNSDHFYNHARITVKEIPDD